jgi:hypothetical protein
MRCTIWQRRICDEATLLGHEVSSLRMRVMQAVNSSAVEPHPFYAFFGSHADDSPL